MILDVINEGGGYKFTSPEEIEKFYAYIDARKGQYDIIIDGTNLLFAVPYRDPKVSEMTMLKSMATLIKLSFKQSFKPLTVVVPMTQKCCWFEVS